MIQNKSILSTPLQTGAFGLALAVLFILALVVRSLLGMVSNDLNHIEQRLTRIESRLDLMPFKEGG